jgi:5,10-methylene-tetrahydrofolate dehydrogenase/methenyl tetrahydrofolate cyclohydrolase
MPLYSNNPIKAEFKEYLKQEFTKLKIKSDKEFVLNIVQIGDNLASSKYVGIKKKIGAELGVVVNHHHFEDGIPEQDLVDLYNNASDNGQGFIFQLPLPSQYSHLVPLTPLNTDVDLLSKSSFLLWTQGYLPPTIGAIDLIYKEMLIRKMNGLVEVENVFEVEQPVILSEAKDPVRVLDKVDGENSPLEMTGTAGLVPATHSPKGLQSKTDGVDDVTTTQNGDKEAASTTIPFSDLVTQKADYAGKIVAVIGQGVLVGSPLVKYLLDRNATIITVNQFTTDSKALTSQADVIFSGAGVANLVNKNWIKKDAIVIDAATSGVGGEIFGDVNKDDIDESTYLCPSPKGVGPVTVLYIFWNLLRMVG